MENMWGESVVKLRAEDAKRGQLFDEGNYAMFIHWGLYSQLANRVDEDDKEVRRFLQVEKLQRVGVAEAIHREVRVLADTNRDWEEVVREDVQDGYSCQGTSVKRVNNSRCFMHATRRRRRRVPSLQRSRNN